MPLSLYIFGVLIICVLCVIIYWLINKNKRKSIKHEGIPVVIVNDNISCITAINELISYDPIFVGFDCEWKSNILRGEKQNKISLIQIGHNKLIILIRIHLFYESIPIELISFLRDVNIIKCGVGISGDAKKLKNDYNIEIYGIVDINDINSDSNHLGLEKMANKLLKKEMKYKHSINHRNWEYDKLNETQIFYASDDAIVGWQVFNEIIKTQYQNNNIMEICFGKIDVYLNRSNNHKINRKSNTKQTKMRKENHNQLENNKNNGMIKLLAPNGDFLTILSIKTAKTYLKKKWAIKSGANIIKLAFPVKPIDIDHDDLCNYQRVITVQEYQCMVCGQDKPEHLMWFFVVYRYLYKLWIKSADDPYKVLICKNCNKKAVIWIHEYHDEVCKILLSETDKFNEMYRLHEIRNICHKLKHKKKLNNYTVSEQNEFVQQILEYCNIDEVDRNNIFIKECDFNIEMNIYWWYNKNDYNYIIIRDCIDKICKERIQRKKECNDWIRDQILNIYKNRNIEFCELWRKSFMKRMNPKYYNKKYETFEFYVGSKRENIVERYCKHKIIDKNGNLLTRSSRIFSDVILNNNNNNSFVQRINNKTIQCLDNINPVIMEYDDTENKYDSDDVKRSIIWIPFQEIKCYICYNSKCLQIFDVFPKYYNDDLFGNNNIEKEITFNMQTYIPLCFECTLKAKRMQKEFESYLYLKHNEIENELFYALQLSQQCERYKLEIKQQNDYISCILKYFNIFDIEIIIKEYHCNKEMDIDWYYIDQYEYILVKECIQKLIKKYHHLYRSQLCHIFKNNKLQFVQIWIQQFNQQNNREQIQMTAFQI